MAQFIKYYVSGHTAEGYVNYLSSNLQDIEHVIILKHSEERALTDIFKTLSTTYAEKNYDVEMISGLLDKEAVAGVIIRAIDTAILAESIVNEPIPKATFLDMEQYSTEHTDSFDQEREGEVLKAAYTYFKKGLQIHDQLEEIYIQAMDFKKADQVAADFINKLLKDIEPSDRTPLVLERLFGTNTPEGKQDHVQTLIAPLQNVFYVKGRAGTGKSVFMKKVLQACTKYGLDTEVYRCSFDPESVDMIIVRALDFSIFDSTPPHEYFPENEEEGETIDLYEATVASGTDERYAVEIEELTTTYQTEMEKGMRTLAELKKVYGKPVDHLQKESALEALYDLINNEI